jgi:hypothetical protein
MPLLLGGKIAAITFDLNQNFLPHYISVSNEEILVQSYRRLKENRKG